jgi:antitoxin ParD1/3/4
MTVTLTPEMEAVINEQLATGQFNSAEQVLRIALLNLQRQYRELKAAIEEGVEDANQGRLAPFSPLETLARVKAARAARMANGE